MSRFLLAGTVSALLCLSAQAASAAVVLPNLLVNGDFSQGATGFQTDYTEVGYSNNSMWGEGTFTIGEDPRAVHDHWVSMSGVQMMMVNGAVHPDEVVWQENGFSSASAANFTFSGKVIDLCCNSSKDGPNSPAEVAFQVSKDGGRTFATVAELVTHGGDAGQLQGVAGTFGVQAHQSFDVRIVDLSTQASGNDFALADLSLIDPPVTPNGPDVLGSTPPGSQNNPGTDDPPGPPNGPAPGDPPGPVISAVPEPAAWLMMILGLGLTGAAQRRHGRPGRSLQARAA